MARIRCIAFAIMVLALTGASVARDHVRIDASTDASAQASWDRMLGEASEETKSKLQAALFQLNAAAATEKGWHGLAYHAALQDPSVAKIRERIAGLCAEQVNRASRPGFCQAALSEPLRRGCATIMRNAAAAAWLMR